MNKYYGNRYWNNATANDKKTVVSVDSAGFEILAKYMDDAGINFYAVQNGTLTRIAINTKDVDIFKRIVGRELADRLRYQKSAVKYTPPKMNIIGNTQYRYIPQKSYFKGDSDLILKMAQIMERSGIKFSGRIYSEDSAALTVSRSDLDKIKDIENIVNHQKNAADQGILTVSEEDKAALEEIFRRTVDSRAGIAAPKRANVRTVGNISADSIVNKAYYKLNMSEEKFGHIQPLLDKMTDYSGIIENGRIMLITDNHRREELVSSLYTAAAERQILDDLMNHGYSGEQISAMQGAILDAAVNEAVDLNMFVSKDYSPQEIAQISPLISEYVKLNAAERMTLGNDIFEKIIAHKEEFDRRHTLDSFFSEHTYISEQKDALAKCFDNGVPISSLQTIDERFTPEEIEVFLNMWNDSMAGKTDPYDVSRYLDDKHWEHLSAGVKAFSERESTDSVPTEEEDLFPQADPAKFIAEDTPSSDEWNDIPDISDDTVKELISAFESAAIHGWEKGDSQPKLNRIKKALYDILGNEEQTEKAFAIIAKEKYHVSFEAEKTEKQPDSLTFHFGNGDGEEWFSESEIVHDFAMAHPDCSFALGNAVMEYLDEKQHTERNIEELRAGWYKKTDFIIHAVINGEEFNYEGRFDIGDGNGTGGGSLIDHIRDYNQEILEYTQYPFEQPEYKERAKNTLDVLVPFLEAHSELTLHEQEIFNSFVKANPIRDENYLKAQRISKEQGIPFSEDYSDGTDEESDPYAYDGSMPPEDFRKMQLLYDLSEITKTDDDTPYRLIEAFESSAVNGWENDETAQNKIRRTLYDILKNDDLTEKTYNLIAANIGEINAEIITDIDDTPKQTEPGDKGSVSLRKVGDFYEMYGKDAKIGAEVLGLRMLSKNGSPMVGFSDHVKDEYSKKLRDAGYIVLTESPLDKAVRLINDYCEKEFDTKANFSNMDHIDLAYTTDEETEIPIEVYADLETYRLVKEYGGKVVDEELFDSVDDMNAALEYLEFDDLVSLSDEEKAAITADKTENVLLSDDEKSVNDEDKIHAAFKKVTSAHDFSGKALELLNRAENQMKINGYTELVPDLFRLPAFEQTYGRISRINNTLFDGKFKDIISLSSTTLKPEI